MGEPDFYSILGVSRRANVLELKERYRFLSQAYHPDKFATDGHRQVAEEEFKRISEAYRVLSDPAARARYDTAREGEPERFSTPVPYEPDQVPTRTGRGQAGWWWLGLLAAGVIVAGAAWAGLKGRTVQPVANHEEVAEPPQSIPPAEIELADLTPSPDPYGIAYEISGRVINHSARCTLGSFLVQVTVRDAVPGGRVDIIGEGNFLVHSDTPPGQARNVNVFAHFPGMPKPRGQLGWSYVVMDAHGWPPEQGQTEEVK